jgi:hypothetical protein
LHECTRRKFVKQCEACREIMPADMFLPHVAAGCKGEFFFYRLSCYVVSNISLEAVHSPLAPQHGVNSLLLEVPESTVRCPLCQMIMSPSDESAWKRHLMEGGGCPKNKKSLPASTRRAQVTRSNTLQHNGSSVSSSATLVSSSSSSSTRTTGRSASVSRTHGPSSFAINNNSSPVSPSGLNSLEIPEYGYYAHKSVPTSLSSSATTAAGGPSSLYSPTSSHHYTRGVCVDPDTAAAAATTTSAPYPQRYIHQDSIHPLDPICPPNTVATPHGGSSISHSASSHQVGRGSSSNSASGISPNTSNSGGGLNTSSSRIPKLGNVRSVSSNSVSSSTWK